MSKYTHPTLVDMAREYAGKIKATVVQAVTVLYTNVISEKNDSDGITVYGDVALQEDLSVAGDVTMSGAVSGAKATVETISDNTTLTAADSGKVFIVDTDAKTITLPATVAGLEFTFINGGADDAVLVTVDPDDNDGIYGTIAAVSMTGTDGGALTNTKSGANNGDYARIVADGSDGWYITGGVGVWAGA